MKIDLQYDAIAIVDNRVLVIPHITMIDFASKRKVQRQDNKGGVEVVEWYVVPFYIAGVREPSCLFFEQYDDANEAVLNLTAKIEAFHNAGLANSPEKHTPDADSKVEALAAMITQGQKEHGDDESGLG